MSKKFAEYKRFDLSEINKEILEYWEKNKTFEQSIKTREGHPEFVFYEGPPSANGMPGIHHVMARTIKDVFCRYKTQQGYLVKRKAGWDTHGLPVELGVEKMMGITKEDIGRKISIEEYNSICRREVMKYTDKWEDLTRKMGYWVDMNDPYITYDNRYIETLWHLLKKLHEKGFLYKGYSIQPFSPAAGTGLSTHELNQPGCYRDVTDTTMVAQFKIINNPKSKFLFTSSSPVYFLAWTTTPWTLPSNTALAVGEEIDYVKIKTFNPYLGTPIEVILAKNLIDSFFPSKNSEIPFESYKTGDKQIPFNIIANFKGKELVGIRYEQLIPFHKPNDGDAFVVLPGDFVTTEDGTGIVHLAPCFGADDFRTCKKHGIGSLLLVDREGKFIQGMGDLSGRFVKNQFDPNLTETDVTVDVDIAVMLKKENKAFKIEKHTHSYPHCWRTDKPVLYYPLDSWFIKTTAVRERMIELNNTINWKPESTGTGRFGKWLENLVDWNLSRSRYWGTPLPIWASEDYSEIKCIGSVEELKNEIIKSVKAGVMKSDPWPDFVPGNFSNSNYNLIDLHKPFVDQIVLISDSGKPMHREPDLIDVWFDSGAMPYAQFHFPFEINEKLNSVFPADFIAEGVDQTRGWFFTLHALATMLFDSVAFKNIISNGLVLDKNGNKMSKRLGNAVDPFETIHKFGSDPLRWYMITNAQPWDNLKFDSDGIDEVKRKFFGTLYNTYSFFALYANIDGFHFNENKIPINERLEIDQWIISLLNTLIAEVTDCYENYEPTKAGRAIQLFVNEHLSNWYVRLNRKRFWGGEYNNDKIAAYQTLYTCLETVSLLAAPIAPFYMDKLFMDLNSVSKKHNVSSVHLSQWPKFNPNVVNKELENRMELAQTISSMVLSLRKKVNIKVRQPLNKILIPVFEKQTKKLIQSVENIILSEVNIKSIEFVDDTTGILVKKIKPNFKTLGPKFGKQMKDISNAILSFNQTDIQKLEKEGLYNILINNQNIPITFEDVEISSEDIPGWQVMNEGKLTVALDVNITEELRHEGLARELINRIQNIRKESGFDVTDKIKIDILSNINVNQSIEIYKDFIAGQTLAREINIVDKLEPAKSKSVEMDENVELQIKITRLN